MAFEKSVEQDLQGEKERKGGGGGRKEEAEQGRAGWRDKIRKKIRSENNGSKG